MVGERPIASVQLVVARGDVERNVSRHVALADRATRAGAALVLFPELSLTGYELELADRLAFEEEDARLDPLRALAEDRDAVLVVGAPIRLRALHLGAFLVGPGGALDVYTKRRLGTFPPETNPGGPVPPPEPSVFVPGERDPLVRHANHVAAVAICADVGDPEHPRRAVARGAELYLASMFFPPIDRAAEHARLADHARAHGIDVLLANHGGPTGGLDGGGASALWRRDGTLAGRLADRGEGILLAARDVGAAAWTCAALDAD